MAFDFSFGSGNGQKSKTNWGQVGGMMGASAISGLGRYFGAKESANGAQKAAKIQAAEMKRSQQQAEQFQMARLGDAQNIMGLHSQVGKDAMGGWTGFNDVGGIGGGILGQMNDLTEQGINMDYQNDPAYQWRQEQNQEALQRQMASMGGLDSRLSYDIQGDRAMALSGEESDKQYLRGVDEYNRNYGNLANQYNYQYGGLTDQVNLGYGADQSLARMYANVGGNVGSQIMNSGLSSATNTADLTAQAGQQMGRGYAGLGNSFGEMMSAYSLREPISDIFKSFGKDKPSTSYGNGGYGQTQQKQSYDNNPYSLMGGNDYNPYSLRG